MADTQSPQNPVLTVGPNYSTGFYYKNPNTQYPAWVPVNSIGEAAQQWADIQRTIQGATLDPRSMPPTQGGGAAAGGASAGGGAGGSWGSYYNPAYSYGLPGTGSYGALPGGSMASGTTSGQIPLGVWGTASPADIAEWQTWYGRNQGKTILVNGQLQTIGQDIGPDALLNAFRSNTVGWGTPTVGQFGQQAPTYFGAGATAPETTALGQMAQIDPATEALRQQLAASYATPLSQAQAPSAATIQNYLNQYQQLDPQSYAALQALGPQYQSYLNTAVNQAALGSQLDPITQMQLQQQVRAAQGARGNVYGTPQLVEEAMTTGQAGLQLQQQRFQNLATALGGEQSYLGSGLTPGSIGLNLYQQNLANLRAAQQGAQSYLGSGQTPYQAGAGYLANAQNTANAASQGFSMGQPIGLAPSYSYLNPTYGQQTANTALGYYGQMGQLYGANLMYGQGQQGGGLGGALGGAASGAASGALLGSVVPGIGTAVGAIGGGLLGAAGGYFG